VQPRADDGEGGPEDGDGGADDGDGGGGGGGDEDAVEGAVSASHAARAAVPFPVGTLFGTGRSTYLEVTHIHGDDDREYRYLNGRYKGLTYTVALDEMPASNILQDRDKAKLLLLVTTGDALRPLVNLQAAAEPAEEIVPESAAHVPKTWVPAKDRVDQETFISANGERNLDFFPNDKAYQQFIKHHKSALLSTSDEASKTVQKMNTMPKQQQFW
jgi:hypothetical protein